MPSLLPADDRRGPLALMLLVIVLFLGYWVVIHPFVRAHLELSEEISDRRSSAARYQQALAEKPLLEAELAELRESGRESSFFIAATDPNLAASQLTQRIKEAIQQHADDTASCQLISNTTVRPRDEERFERVAIKLRMRCSLDDFLPVLHALEGGEPYVFVDNMTIYQPPARRRRINRDQIEEVEQALDLRFDLFAYYRDASPVVPSPTDTAGQ